MRTTGWMAILVFLLCWGIALPQSARKYLAQGRLHYFNGELKKALNEYQRAHALSPGNPTILRELGICMAQVWGYQTRALPLLRQASEFYPRDPLVLYYLARAYQLADSCEKAIPFYRKAIAVSKQKKLFLQIKALADRGARECGLRLASSPAADISIAKLPADINTSTEDEYGVFLTSDETTIFFTRSKSTGIAVPSIVLRQDAAIYISMIANDKWTKAYTADSAVPLLLTSQMLKEMVERGAGILTAPINTSAFWERTAWLSPEGMALYISRGEPFAAWGDIMLTTLEPGGWSIPTRLPSQINSPHWEGEIALSPDRKIIVFTSNRNGGKGGTDLWVSQLIEGQWTAPQNLELLNTEGNERYPFITADGNWLVFSSDGHPGIGGYDLFAVRIGSGFSLGRAEPLPYPLNTAYDELNIWVSPDLFRAYFSSNRQDSTLDIYVAYLESGFMGEGTRLVLKGRVLLNGVPVRATFLVYEIRRIGTRQTLLGYVGEFASDQSGNYLLVLAPDKRYRLMISVSGTLLFSEMIKLGAPAGKFHIVEKDFDINTDIALDSVVLTTARLPRTPDTTISSYMELYEIQWLANYLWQNLFLTAHIHVYLPPDVQEKRGHELCSVLERYLSLVEVNPERISCTVHGSTRDSLLVGVKFAGLPVRAIPDTIAVRKPSSSIEREPYMQEVEEQFSNVRIKGLTYKIVIGKLHATEVKLTETHLRALKFLQRFSIEEELAPDGSTSILIGEFQTFGEAKNIQQTIMLLGIQNPKIVPYINEKRSSWQEVLSLLKGISAR